MASYETSITLTFSTLFLRQRTVASAAWEEVLRCTTSDSDTFQPFVAPQWNQDTRDKTASSRHFSAGQPVCDSHRFETHSWQPFFQLRWQLTVSNVVPLFVKSQAWQPVEVIGARPIILGHDRTQPQSLASMSWGKTHFLIPNTKLLILNWGAKGILPRWREMVFVLGDRCSKLAFGGSTPKSRNLVWTLGFGVVIYSPAQEFISSDYESRQLR